MPRPPFADAAVVFDLDGTLVDTAPDLAAAMNAVLAAHGRDMLPVAHVRPLVGRGARALMREGFAATGRAAEEPGELDALAEALVAYYADNIAAASRPFPGCVDALDDIAARGATLAVCTNKRGVLAEKLLQALDMRDKFVAVVGGDALPVRKPDPAHLRACLDAASPFRNAALVGDSISDAGAAKGAGTPFVLAEFGYIDASMKDLAPAAAFKAYAELPALLERLFSARAL